MVVYRERVSYSSESSLGEGNDVIDDDLLVVENFDCGVERNSSENYGVSLPPLTQSEFNLGEFYLNSTQIPQQTSHLNSFSFYFNELPGHLSIRDKIKLKCDLYDNNFFIGKKLEDIESHISPFINPRRVVPLEINCLKSFKQLKSENKIFAFCLENINAPFCQVFKENLGNFSSVRSALDCARQIIKKFKATKSQPQSQSAAQATTSALEMKSQIHAELRRTDEIDKFFDLKKRRSNS